VFLQMKIAKKLLFVCLAITLLLVLLAAGCQPEQDNGTAVLGDEVLNIYGTDPHTLDPAISGDATSHEYIMQIYSGLVRLDDELQPVADIAEEWKVSNDGKTYTFTLRRDVKFHDGKEVTAYDFKYSWERACLPETGSQTAPTYLGDIVGADEMLAGVAPDISGVRVVNDYTLEVTIDAPRPYFIYKMAYTTAFVVDRENVESAINWWRTPNGTGPFKLGKWKENELIRLDRNADYYGQVAQLASVNFQLLAGVPMNLYETGEIDVTGVSLSYIDKVTDERGPFLQDLMIVPQLSFSYIGFNCSKPPFDDPDIRRAFSMAIDKEKIASLTYRNMVEVAYGILPPGLPGYNEDLDGLEFDAEQAKELIENSSYGDVSALPQITITDAGWGASIGGSMEAIIAQWKQNLGVDVQVRLLEPDIFLYSLMEEKDEMYSMGWIADYPHPQDFLEILFKGSSKNNYGEYLNEQVDALLEEAGLEMDNERSLELYQQVEQLLVNDAACIPLWFGQNYILVKDYVENYNPTPLGIPRYNEIVIE